ncbi:lipoyl(octanoyl) transferase LipB [Pseudokineococcus sp. 5B2Z-1]|uniref:lipoyl(octanoyl) transferase LipB n=1 Tax=Pseudokineococcus sp. 5B2Z-1 TaxID=3132744 RepID=UPI0030B556C9
MRFEHVGFGSDAVEYRRGWELQRAAHAEVVAGAEDVVLLLEHEAVYTAGKRTLPHERPFDGTPVVDVDRGGKITWHGPGQLVGYPITRLTDPVDVVAYVRRLEQVLIDACAELGLATERVEGRSGVWVRGDDSGLPGRRDRKVGAIGIRVAQGVTMHGFALNCDNALDGFGGIVPCGIPDADVTTLTAELGRPLRVADALPVVERHLAATLPAGERPAPAAATV